MKQERALNVGERLASWNVVQSSRRDNDNFCDGFKNVCAFVLSQRGSASKTAAKTEQDFLVLADFDRWDFYRIERTAYIRIR